VRVCECVRERRLPGWRQRYSRKSALSPLGVGGERVGRREGIYTKLARRLESEAVVVVFFVFHNE